MAGQRELVEQLFDAAQAIEPKDRHAFLDRSCGQDAELRQLLEFLLDKDPIARESQQRQADPSKNSAVGDQYAAQRNDPTESEKETAPALPPNRPCPGNVLNDRFLIVRFIARGGMGEVYEVEDLILQGVRLALKTVLPQAADDSYMQKRFEREVLLARKVIHPNLCPIYDIFHCEWQGNRLTFLTMKLLPGQTLRDRIIRQSKIELPEAASITKQIGAALNAIHEAGILHRDIKASNIMLDGSGEQVRVCVMDFGLAHAYTTEGQTLTSVAVAGTPNYMAPELFRGRSPSTASDVYAFGILVHEMLTGQLPRIDSKNELPTGENNSFDKLPPEWKRFIRRCVEPDISRRCQTIPDALSTLNCYSFVRPGAHTTCSLLAQANDSDRDRRVDCTSRRNLAGVAPNGPFLPASTGKALCCSHGVARGIDRISPSYLYSPWFNPQPSDSSRSLCQKPFDHLFQRCCGKQFA